MTPAGVVTTFAGTANASGGSTNGIGAVASFAEPAGLAVDSANNIYVADSQNDSIRKITPAGAVTTFAGSPGFSGSVDGTGSSARFNYPSGVAVDSADNIFVADTMNHVIRKITPAGVVTTFAGSAGIWGHTDGIGAAATFYSPYGIAIDSTNNLYVADTYNSIIRKITPAAVVTTIAGTAEVIGSTDGVGALALFNYPYGISIDGANNIFVADYDNSNIRKITPEGIVSTYSGIAGTTGMLNGHLSTSLFYNPRDVKVDKLGNLIIVDSSNNVIRIIK